MEPLELSDWIRRVDELGLIATIDDIAVAPAPLCVVPLDSSGFWLCEGYVPAREAPVERTLYAPTVFFEPLQVVFGEIGDIRSFRGQDGRMFPALRVVYDDRRERPFPASVYSTRGDRQAESGSGDGYTRFMLWSRLLAAALPPVFWRRPVYPETP